MGFKASIDATTMKKCVLIPHDRYMYYKSLAKEQTEPVSTTIATDVVPVDEAINERPIEATDSKLKPEIILAQLPRRNKSKAKALLQYLQSHKTLDWNQRGELEINKTPVPYSHITDIIHDALNNTKYKPVGCDEFYSHLGCVPKSLITNPARKPLVGGAPLPPPGVPENAPKQFDDWKSLWQSH